jgi:hypothetical protein
MILTVLCVVAALVLLAGKGLVSQAKSLAARYGRPEISWQQAAAAGLLVLAAVAFSFQGSTPAPIPPPPPVPVPVGPLDLSGLFSGPAGAEDAAVVAALTGELADELQWDWSQEKPYITTGVAVDELRRRTREMRCRGVSIGARQPKARDAIAGHLDKAVGTSGGPIDQAKKDAWLKALREISEAALDVTQ